MMRSPASTIEASTAEASIAEASIAEASIAEASAVWADALFASTLQSCDEPGAAQVRRAVAEAVRVFGVRGCLARVAQAYGEHSETAVLRMRWARSAVADAFGAAGPEAAQPMRRAQACRAA